METFLSKTFLYLCRRERVGWLQWGGAGKGFYTFLYLCNQREEKFLWLFLRFFCSCCCNADLICLNSDMSEQWHDAMQASPQQGSTKSLWRENGVADPLRILFSQPSRWCPVGCLSHVLMMAVMWQIACWESGQDLSFPLSLFHIHTHTLHLIKPPEPEISFVLTGSPFCPRPKPCQVLKVRMSSSKG